MPTLLQKVIESDMAFNPNVQNGKSVTEGFIETIKNGLKDVTDPIVPYVLSYDPAETIYSLLDRKAVSAEDLRPYMLQPSPNIWMEWTPSLKDIPQSELYRMPTRIGVYAIDFSDDNIIEYRALINIAKDANQEGAKEIVKFYDKYKACTLITAIVETKNRKPTIYMVLTISGLAHTIPSIDSERALRYFFTCSSGAIDENYERWMDAVVSTYEYGLATLNLPRMTIDRYVSATDKVQKNRARNGKPAIPSFRMVHFNTGQKVTCNVDRKAAESGRKMPYQSVIGHVKNVHYGPRDEGKTRQMWILPYFRGDPSIVNKSRPITMRKVREPNVNPASLTLVG